MKPRAAVILIEKGKIAMIERYRDGQHYVVFPGGKIERGETPESAARREIKEELGLDVRIGKMVAEIWYLDTPQYYFLAQRIEGEFGTGRGKEMDSSPDSPKGSHLPVWILLNELIEQPVFPVLLAKYIVNSYPDQWPTLPLVIKENPPKDIS